jgi:hypothetical protein
LRQAKYLSILPELQKMSLLLEGAQALHICASIEFRGMNNKKKVTWFSVQ